MDRNRKTAYEVLLKVEEDKAFSNLALNNFIARNQADNPAFVRELVYGVLRNRLLLDYYLNALIRSGVGKVKTPDLLLLRMGVYQLAFMGSVPAYAAVNETVEMAKRLCHGRDRFVNGVLRSFLRQKALPALPDRGKDPVGFLSVNYSVAPWIVRLWLEQYGAEETEKLLQGVSMTPRLSLRVNLLKTTTAELRTLLAQEGFETTAGRLSPRALLVSGRGSGILENRYFREGWFSVQDESSITAIDTLRIKPGDTVVDLCAAPGGKTMAMAERMEEKGQLLACDLYPHKLDLIAQQAERLGISIVRTACYDATQRIDALREKADCVLADVPCSGLGVMRRRPEIRYKDSDGLAELVALQRKILQNAGTYVKRGGMLMYSTCTINPAENEEQVKAFLREHRAFMLAEMRQLFPGEENDGFFFSKMIRLA